MIETAVAAGIQAAGERCLPNVFILFSDDSGEDIERLLKSRNPLLAELTGDEVRALRRQPTSVRTWGVTQVYSSDGDRLTPSDPRDPPMLTVSTSSRVGSPIRNDILVSVVMIDRRVVPGKSVRQIAGYAAMRAFARTRPATRSRVDTILSLFDDAPATAPPADLTGFDRGYLRTLYQGRANSLPSQKQARLAAGILSEDGQAAGVGVPGRKEP